MRVRIAILSLLAFSIGCSHPSLTSEESNWLDVTSAVAGSRLHGVWRNPSLGHIAVFNDGKTKIFHDYGDLCIADTGVVPPFSLVSFGERSDTVHLHYYDYRDHPALLQNPLEYLKIDEIPAECLDQSLLNDVPLIDVFDLVWKVFNERFAAFEKRRVDWDAQKQLYRARALTVNSDDELFDLIAEMLTPLRDGHVNLTFGDRSFNAGSPRLRNRLTHEWARTSRDTSEGAFVGDWSRQVRASAIELLDSGTHRFGGNRALEWGTIGGDVGYLRINRFGGFLAESPSRQADLVALRKSLRQMSNDLANTKHLIVDVAHNGGGNDAAAMTVVEHFLDSPREVLTYRVDGAPDRSVHLSPSRGGSRKSISLVTSEITASAAESFVLMMRALPHVEHVGEATRGDISSLLPKPLPRGFRVTVAYQKVLDENQNWYEAQGIPPERQIELFPENKLFEGYAEAIQLLANDVSSTP